MRILTKLLRRRFFRDENGAITPLMLLFVLLIFVVGGVGVDYSYAQKSRSELQGAADAAAHAALYVRQEGSAADARAAAVSVVESILPRRQFGDVLDPNNVTFGFWDKNSQTFVIDQNSKEAVLVSASRLASEGNAVPAFFMRFVGKESWDIRAGAVFKTYLPTCFREGFAADGIVDLQSNNSFTNGFCIHSNTYVSVNSNNQFTSGTVVSMPDKSNIDLPNSGFETNTGLRSALRDKKYNIRILNRISDIADKIQVGDPEYLPTYIVNSTVRKIGSNYVDGMEGDEKDRGGEAETFLQAGHIYTQFCGGGKTLTFKEGTTIRNVVILTNCSFKFGQGVKLENTILLTTNSDSRSVFAASGLQIGRDDNCSKGGGAQIVTHGGVRIPADLRLYGGQIIARGDIRFAANANGIEGASMISGGSISGTSNMTMGFCGSGMEENFAVPYFQLAK